MSVATEVVAKVQKYLEQLKKEKKIRHALSRLNKIEMTVDLLRKTGVGKAVKLLCEHKVHGKDATRILTKWMDLARNKGIIATPKPSSFQEALNSGVSAAPQKSRKRSGSPVPSSSKFPRLHIHISPPNSSFINPVSHKEDKENINSETMFKAKTERVKVFAGRRKNQNMTEVSTLMSMCQNLLSRNISLIKVTRSARIEVLRPVFDRCSQKQLEQIERQNPKQENVSNEVWERIFKKSFDGKAPNTGESYKKAFLRMTKRTEKNLEEVSQRIKTSMSKEMKDQKKAMIAIGTPLGRQRQAMDVIHTAKSAGGRSKPPMALPTSARPSSSSTTKKTEATTGPMMLKLMKVCKNKRH